MASFAAAGDAAPPGLDPATVATASQTFAALAIGSCAPAVGALDGEVEAHLTHIDAISANLENVRAHERKRGGRRRVRRGTHDGGLTVRQFRRTVEHYAYLGAAPSAPSVQQLRATPTISDTRPSNCVYLLRDPAPHPRCRRAPSWATAWTMRSRR
jgi:hypothetical protein